MVDYGVELFKLSKDQFKLYFDTLFRLRSEVRIELFPEKNHVYVRAVNKEKTLMSELILNVTPKEMVGVEIPLESIMKLSPKKDVTFYRLGNQVTLKNEDFILKVTTLDERVSQLSEVAEMPEIEFTSYLYLDKPVIERWYDFFKAIKAEDGVEFMFKDGEFTVGGKAETESDRLELPAVQTDQPDCEVVIPISVLIDAFAHWKVYDTVKIAVADRMPLYLEFGSDLLKITTLIAPIYRDDD